VLFCKPVERRATENELFKIVDDDVKEKKHKMVRLHGFNSFNGSK
jgi:hypothetical protein